MAETLPATCRAPQATGQDEYQEQGGGVADIFAHYRAGSPTAGRGFCEGLFTWL